MTPHAFITKWRASALKERSASQEHFIDLCRLLGEPTPAEADPSGETYCFERGVRKDTGGDGWADVWKRHHFAWEYKGKRADLDAAFGQLRQYSLALENPPLLIVSDMVRFRIRTNWTNSVSRTHEFELDDLADASIVPVSDARLVFRPLLIAGKMLPLRVSMSIWRARSKGDAMAQKRGAQAESLQCISARIVSVPLNARGRRRAVPSGAGRMGPVKGRTRA